MKIRILALTILVLVLLSGSALAADQWITVQSKNFHLIGNAKEKDIRAAATKLEQFKEVFGFLFPRYDLTGSVPTNVVVFKNKKSYKPFLPKRADGKPDTGIAGYFQPGEEVNYITLSAGGDRADTFETIFHEYVHFLLNNNFERSQIPPWLNEGIAEYYSTFEIKDDRKVLLGKLRNDHLFYLNSSKLIPLEQFFSIDNYSLHRNGDHSRSVFYAQAWALVHYFAIKNETNRLSSFIELSRSEKDPAKAFKAAFGYDYKEMEEILRRYVRQKKFTLLSATFEKKLDFDKDMRTTPLADKDAFAFLGDLLFRQNELTDAEVYLDKSLALDPAQVRANTSMGLLKMRQKKNAQAKGYLEKAVAAGSGSYYAHYSYAYLLSREDRGDDNIVGFYGAEKAGKIRGLLNKAIRLNSKFAPAYNLHAFVNLVMDENLDDAEKYLRKSLALQPGNESSVLNLAQIYVRRKEFDKAEALANSIMKSAVDERQRYNANQILSMVKSYRDVEARNRELAERYRNDPTTSISDGFPTGLSGDELERIAKEREISELNGMLPKLSDGEVREIGFIRKITCDGYDVSYEFQSLEGKNLRFKSQGFEKLELVALAEMGVNETIGCDYRLQETKVVVNFAPGSAAGPGNLQAVTFVPGYFRLKSKEEIEGDKKVVILSTGPGDKGRAIEVDGDSPEAVKEAVERERKRMMTERFRSILRKPAAGEKRIFGTIEKIECSSKNGFGIKVKTADRRYGLNTKTPQGLIIVTFRRDIDASLRCGGKPPNAAAVIIYDPGKKTSGSDGKLISLEFVPEGFTID